MRFSWLIFRKQLAMWLCKPYRGQVDNLSHIIPTRAWARRSFVQVLAILGFCLLFSSGCVERRMVIRSNPPGALAYVDDYENPVGMTPCATNFTYYGTRKIRLVKDGYETLTVMQPLPSPWYEITPLDFISENFVPGEIRDQRVLDYQLTPQMVAPADQLRARAEQLRAGVHVAAGVPPSALGIAPPPAGAGAAPPSGTGPSGGESIPTPTPVPAPLIPPPPPSSGIGGHAVPALPPQ